MTTQEPGSSRITQEQVKELLTSLRNVKKDTVAVIDEKMTHATEARTCGGAGSC